MFLIIVILGVSLIVMIVDNILEKSNSLYPIEKQTLSSSESLKNFLKKVWLFLRNLLL